MSNVKYTFLLPAYKPQFLAEAIRSILQQTYQNFSVIISDDCSPHNLQEIVEKFDDPRISYRRNAENMGGKSLVSHWNLLVNMAHSEYLIMASDDDIYDPTFLEEIDSLTIKYPNADLLRARVRFINGENQLLQEDLAFEEHVSSLKYIYDQYDLRMLKCMANFVFKTKPIQQEGGFLDFPLAWYSDIATVIRHSNHGVVNTRDILFSFRCSGLNISSVEQTDRNAALKKLDATFKYDHWMNQFLQTVKVGDSLWDSYMYNDIKKCHKQEILVKISNYAKHLKFQEFWPIFKEYNQKQYFDSFSKKFWLLKRWFYK